MANIVDIKKYVKEKNKTNEIKAIFELVSSELEEVRKKHWLEMDDEDYELLEENFKNIKSNIKYDKWLPLYNQKKFVDSFNNLYKIPKTNEENYYELYDKVFMELEFITICNLDDYILKNDIERIKLIVHGIAQGIEEIDLKFLPKYVRDLSDSRLDKYLDEETSFDDKRDFMADISSCLAEHLPLDYLLKIKEESKNVVSEEVDDLDNGILTINRVKNFYLTGAYNLNNFFNDIISEITINNLKIMDKINDYDYDSKDKFLDLVRHIRRKNDGLVDSINYVGELTHMFITNKDKIGELDVSTLLLMLKLDHESIDDRIKSRKK